MNREQRRQLAKINAAEIKRAERHMLEAQQKLMTEGRAEAMFLLHTLALHELYGFGAQRCFRVMDWVDQEMGKWLTGESDLDKLRKRVNDEVGIRIDFTGR